MKIVLGHDSFTQLGGAERVAASLHELFPQSIVRTLVVDKNIAHFVEGWDIRTSWLKYLYCFHPRFQHMLFFIPMALKAMRVKNCDVFLTSSSGLIKCANVATPVVHVNYCHTPTRFLWLDPGRYMEQEVPAFMRPFLNVYLQWMKRWDLRAARRVDCFIANSKEVQKRIKQIYGRESQIIYPFIDIHFWKPTRPKGNFFLVAGRLQAHKGNELIIEIFNELGWPLHVIGTGRQENYLKYIAKPNIKFLGRVPDEILRDEYSAAQGFIYPQFEDLGLMPLEAAACGTATLGLAKGGSLETIKPGITGELFAEQKKDLIREALENFDHHKYRTEDLRRHAEYFSEERFQQQIKSLISQVASSKTSHKTYENRYRFT